MYSESSRRIWTKHALNLKCLKKILPVVELGDWCVDSVSGSAMLIRRDLVRRGVSKTSWTDVSAPKLSSDFVFEWISPSSKSKKQKLNMYEMSKLTARLTWLQRQSKTALICTTEIRGTINRHCSSSLCKSYRRNILKWVWYCWLRIVSTW
jgi:hypothetical protein